jgi:predicted nuclease of restriction endonuclease-like (RecB) superfamily
MPKNIIDYTAAIRQIKKTILQSRYLAARLANGEQLKLYFHIGGYVSTNTREGKWGTGAIEEIAKRLQTELPGLRGFSASAIRYMRIFYEAWVPEINHHLLSDEMAQTEIHHLPSDEFMAAFFSVGFTHHREILAHEKSIDGRMYYIRCCAKEYWSVEALKTHLRAKDFQRLGMLPNNFSLTIPDENHMSRAVRSFKDEYLLDFVNIEDSEDEEDIDERVLEQSIVSNIRKFIQSLGPQFSFIGNQYRLVVDDNEFFVDLLFFHRGLRCLVAIELKRGAFKPAYLGQMNFYLSALDEYVKEEGENPAIGLILCKSMKRTIVDLAIRDFNKPMGVALYRTDKEIPANYQILSPVISGVRKILENGAPPPPSGASKGD